MFFKNVNLKIKLTNNYIFDTIHTVHDKALFTLSETICFQWRLIMGVETGKKIEVDMRWDKLLVLAFILGNGPRQIFEEDIIEKITLGEDKILRYLHELVFENRIRSGQEKNASNYLRTVYIANMSFVKNEVIIRVFPE